MKRTTMTPKEKAKELVKKFTLFSEGAIYDEETGEISLTPTDQAKQCALICVDEIMKSNPTVVEINKDFEPPSVYYVSNEKYWQKVKQEIEKL